MLRHWVITQVLHDNPHSPSHSSFLTTSLSLISYRWLPPSIPNMAHTSGNYSGNHSPRSYHNRRLEVPHLRWGQLRSYRLIYSWGYHNTTATDQTPTIMGWQANDSYHLFLPHLRNNLYNILQTIYRAYWYLQWKACLFMMGYIISDTSIRTQVKVGYFVDDFSHFLQEYLEYREWKKDIKNEASSVIHC